MMDKYNVLVEVVRTDEDGNFVDRLDHVTMCVLVTENRKEAIQAQTHLACIADTVLAEKLGKTQTI